ncbi:MAG: hypothetical protein F6K50_12345 [Moorea sp. SIO3I7]|uniref:hypothetical protein n=1 Tax=Moorena sp. SIO3I8 TaxID=2607833 RepID=UPI0013BEFAF8|nr:hypothetical protein [Moorena sp. SIO3I8]NEN96296.1 hypothetical protein [Moorena sp. SIO3I7]NEO04938.1 hypothetical protein [Moorena sp. SIO3I8]NEP54748.1 hypothetical protein [Moorena sp. SIO3C2]
MRNLSKDEKYEFMVMAIATYMARGSEAAVREFGVTARTIRRWRKNAREEASGKMQSDIDIARQALENSWVRDCKNPIQVGCKQLAKRMETAKTAEDAKVIDSIAKAVDICANIVMEGGILYSSKNSKHWYAYRKISDKQAKKASDRGNIVRGRWDGE